MNEGDDRIDDGLDGSSSSNWQGFVYCSGMVEDSHNLPGSLSNLEKVRSMRGMPLSVRQVGDRVQIVSLNCGEANQRFMGMGLMPGVVLEVISCTSTGSVIVALQDQRLGLGVEMAQRIQVIDIEPPLGERSNHTSNRTTTMQTTSDSAIVKLRDAVIGATLRVIGYEPTARDYKRKLLAMGLTPGTELTVKRHAPLGDPTEITVRGFQLSLRKVEADALIVAPITGS